MEDYLAGTNEWSYCLFYSGYGFPGSCGEYYYYYWYYQSSTFLPTCSNSAYSGRNEIYWFLYDEQLQGEVYQPDWLPTETLSGLPFFFNSVEDIELEHVKISGAGADSAYSLSIQRSSTTPYKSISVINGLGNGVSINGQGLYFFENLSIQSDVPSSGNGIYISNKANVSIDGYYISTVHSGISIYAYGSSISLSLHNGVIDPLSNSQNAIYAYNIDTLDVENFSYTYSGYQYQNPINTYYIANVFSFKNSFINCTSVSQFLNNYNYGSASFLIKNVSFVSSGSMGTFVRSQGGATLVFQDNILLGGQSYNDAVSISGNDLVISNNNFANITTQASLLVLDGNYNGKVTAFNNSISHVKVGSSIFQLRGDSVELMENKVLNAEGDSAIEIRNVDQLEVTRNSFNDPTVKYYVKTESQYESETNGIVVIGTNYWSTTSIDELNKATYDSFYNAALVTIQYDSLFLDSDMTQSVLAPPSQAILDLDKMTLDGTLSEAVTVVVPKGLYYVAGSIVLRHPNAQLLIEPGVRLMFAEHASIRVDYGVLKVEGSVDDPVELSPTQNLTAVYGDSGIENSTVFDGIYFGQYSNRTVLGDGNQYIDGSVMRHCTVKFGGYFSRDASIYLNRVNVMLDSVTVLGDWSRYVNGIYMYSPSDAVLLSGVSVQNVGNIGVHIDYAYYGISLTNVNIRGCHNSGVRIYYPQGSVSLSGSAFERNGGDQVYYFDNSYGEIFTHTLI